LRIIGLRSIRNTYSDISIVLLGKCFQKCSDLITLRTSTLRLNSRIGITIDCGANPPSDELIEDIIDLDSRCFPDFLEDIYLINFANYPHQNRLLSKSICKRKKDRLHLIFEEYPERSIFRRVQRTTVSERLGGHHDGDIFDLNSLISNYLQSFN